MWTLSIIRGQTFIIYARSAIDWSQTKSVRKELHHANQLIWLLHHKALVTLEPIYPHTFVVIADSVPQKTAGTTPTATQHALVTVTCEVLSVWFLYEEETHTIPSAASIV